MPSLLQTVVTVGLALGEIDGAEEGAGERDGLRLGRLDGEVVGRLLGIFVGVGVGPLLGEMLGTGLVEGAGVIAGPSTVTSKLADSLTTPSVTRSCNEYEPGAPNETVVSNEVASPNVALPGPASILQLKLGELPRRFKSLTYPPTVRELPVDTGTTSSSSHATTAAPNNPSPIQALKSSQTFPDFWFGKTTERRALGPSRSLS